MKKIYDELLSLFKSEYGDDQDPKELSKALEINEPMVHSSQHAGKQVSSRHVPQKSFKQKPFRTDIDE